MFYAWNVVIILLSSLTWRMLKKNFETLLILVFILYILITPVYLLLMLI